VFGMRLALLKGVCNLPVATKGPSGGKSNWWRTQMVNRLLKVREVLSSLHREESGQDLIEYALLAALIALAATFGMGVVASDINNAFSKIGSKLSANVT